MDAGRLCVQGLFAPMLEHDRTIASSLLSCGTGSVRSFAERNGEQSSLSRSDRIDSEGRYPCFTISRNSPPTLLPLKRGDDDQARREPLRFLLIRHAHVRITGVTPPPVLPPEEGVRAKKLVQVASWKITPSV